MEGSQFFVIRPEWLLKLMAYFRILLALLSASLVGNFRELNLLVSRKRCSSKFYSILIQILRKEQANPHLSVFWITSKYMVSRVPVNVHSFKMVGTIIIHNSSVSCVQPLKPSF